MSRLILDLSVYDEIDLAEWVEQRDLWGVVLKVGGNEGGRYRDRKFESHYADAKAQGLRIGAYYYTTATDTSTAHEDALHCLSLLDGKDVTLPVYIDVEDPAQLALDMDSMTAMVEAFCETIEGAGHEAGIYSGSQGFALMDDSVCKYSLWLAYWADARPTWATPERGYTMWQQGGMRIDGHVVYGDAPEHHDFDWWYGEEGGTDMDRINEVLELAESQLGVRYWSMHTGPRGSDEEGWGCAMFCAWCLNQVLGTDYYGSAYNFFGDALGDDTYNQGGGEFYFVSEPDAHAGDVVCYCPSGYTATDATDCGHVALLVSDTEVIGAMGHGVPGQSGYLNIGISRTPIYEQSLGGPVRYVRCRRLHEAKPEPTPKPKPEPEPTPETEETTMFCMIHPTGDSKIYYWDGSPETVPYHVSPDEKAAIEDAYAKVNGKSLKTIEVGKAAFDKILAMTKARKAWREQGIAAAVPKPPTADAITKAVVDAIGRES